MAAYDEGHSSSGEARPVGIQRRRSGGGGNIPSQSAGVYKLDGDCRLSKYLMK